MRPSTACKDNQQLCQPSCSYAFEVDCKTEFLVSTGSGRRKKSKAWSQLFASLGFAAIGSLNPLDKLKRRRSKRSKLNGDHFLPLPVGVIEDGSLMRYAWNGHHIQAVEPDVLVNGETGMGNLRAKLRHLRHTVVEAFFPSRDAVTPDYWDYVWWRAGHRLSSAMLNNFATQSLLAAVGVGAQNQLPAAATINWLLKDGLGRLGRLSVAASFGQSFDSDLKRFRWLTSLIFSGSIALEFLTPLVPSQFLVLASLSNVGKSVGVTTYVATHPAFMRSFARGENLADINAKGQAQQMVMDTLGLALCVGLTYAVRNKPRGRMLLPLCSFPLLVAVDLFCIFQELKATHLRTLNRERAEMVAERWLSDGTVFSAAQVSALERHLLPSKVGAGQCPLHFASLEEAIDSPQKLTSLLRRHKWVAVQCRIAKGPLLCCCLQDQQQHHALELSSCLTRCSSAESRILKANAKGQSFLLSYLHQKHRTPYLGSREVQGHLAVTLEEGASPHQILTSVLQAAIFRRLVACPETSREAPKPSAEATAVARVKPVDTPAAAWQLAKGANWEWADFRHMLDAAQTDLRKEDCCSAATASSRAGVKGVRWRWPQIDAETGERAMAISAKLARIASPHFVADIQSGDWQTQPFMISTHERSGFVVLPVET